MRANHVNPTEEVKLHLIQLAHKHLMTLSLTVGIDTMSVIGTGPLGLRRIVPVTGGTFSGGRLKGTVVPDGADWVINRPDGVMMIDVRLTLKTDDGALIYLSYQGRFLANADTMAQLAKGHLIDSDDYSLAMTAKFECGDDRYSWLNNIIAAGTGEHTVNGPIYSIFEIG